MNQLYSKLTNNGYVVVHGIESSDHYINLGQSLGTIINQNDSVPQDKRLLSLSKSEVASKQAFSNLALYPHTDRSILPEPPDLVCLWAKAPAESGGENLIFDAKPFYENIDARKIFDIDCLFSDEDRAGFLFSKIFYKSNNKICIRFRNDNYIYVPPNIAMIFKQICNIIDMNKKHLRLEKNQVLIVDNRRVLHGRTSFQGQREFVRLHINFTNMRLGICDSDEA